jgi:outer membrane protein assembly factor BamD (BamD/ComL family)
MRAWKLLVALVVFVAAPSCSLHAAQAEHGILVRVANIYLSPDSSSAKLGEVERGREVAIFEKSRDWLHVLASVTAERDITGWILGKGVVTTSTPNGDRILYGAAVDAESEASRRRGRKGSAQDALRLYGRTAEYFPNSPLAGESLYRSADIKWQLDREDVVSRPSAKMREAFLREGMDEELMRQVMKKFPHTKWSDLAAFRLIENKLCGDWQGSSKCPEKEAEIYEKYAREHPTSPSVPEALYDAAWRYAALIEIYKTENQSGKSADSKSRAARAAQEIVAKYPQTDWGPRAQSLLYMVEQNIPMYGNTVE